MTRTLPLLALLGLLCGIAIAQTTDGDTGTGHRGAGQNGPAIGPSPHHEDPATCNACHEAGSGGKPGPAKPIVPTCLGCHPDADMHPVLMAPMAAKVPEGWPLEKGLVTCATCHAEPAHGGAEATLPKPWHRGGPYTDINQFCFTCHQESEFARSDPHHPMQSRRAGDPTCSACHTGAPKEGARADDALLRFDTARACTTCHEGEVHAGVSSHLDHPVDPKLAASLGPEIALDAEGEVACWSCHEVHGGATEPPEPRRRPVARGLHDKALAEEWSALADPALSWPGEEKDAAHPPLLARPVTDGSLCRACHGEGP